jgi:flagellar protein FliO/FliZ
MMLFLLEKNVEEFTIKASSSEFVSGIGQIIFFVIVFIGIIFLAYYCTKFLGKSKIQAMNGKNISVIESINIGIGSALYIIKAGEQYFLISVTKENISLISEINADTIKVAPQDEAISFEKIMKECLNKFGQSKK